MQTFYGATSFTGDGLSNWDTSSVTTLRSTFYDATSFTGDGVSNWDTSRVTTLYATFYGATSFTGDGLNWDTSSVTSFEMEHSTVRPRSRETDCQIGIRRG